MKKIDSIDSNKAVEGLKKLFPDFECICIVIPKGGLENTSEQVTLTNLDSLKGIGQFLIKSGEGWQSLENTLGHGNF